MRPYGDGIGSRRPRRRFARHMTGWLLGLGIVTGCSALPPRSGPTLPMPLCPPEPPAGAILRRLEANDPPYLRGAIRVTLPSGEEVVVLRDQGSQEVLELLQDALAYRRWGRECWARTATP
jgi:hypothetical protein